MHGGMMQRPLTVPSIMQHAERYAGAVEIVSVTRDEPRHRYTYAEAFARCRRLANVLDGLGLPPGERVGTLAWNDHRHFELYYATASLGLVCHTINPRLFPEQIAYIINHAEDQWLFIDPDFVPLLEQIAHRCPDVRGYVVLCSAAAMPATRLPNVHCYEALLEEASDQFSWPELEEDAACGLCYTSGTTGNPKGVLYSHRSTLLHAYAGLSADALNIGRRDVIMPVVPMFHVNAWGLPYAAPMLGAKLVFPGNRMGDGATLADLICEEGVTFAAGVPTIWLALLSYLRESGRELPSLREVVVGGAACPAAIAESFDRYGINTKVGWGMTEMSPLGTINNAAVERDSIDPAHFARLRLKAGRPIFGVEMKIVDDDNRLLPHDGKAFGRLKVRGPWVCRSYYKLDHSESHDADGWFDTGDVATIDPDGYMAITDRTKDVIKSGGEWISSIEVENAAMSHPKVAEAAVIGAAHPKWGERPLLVAVRRADGADLEASELLAFLDGRIAKWWIPDAVEFVDELPHGATGKLNKMALRQQFEAYTFTS